MKVYQLIWKLITQFGLFGEADAKVARYATDTIRDSLLDQFGDGVREKFIALVNHKAGTVPLPAFNNQSEKPLVTTEVKPIGGELQFDTAYDLVGHVDAQRKRNVTA